MSIGDWGLGIGDWGLGIWDWAQSPIPIFYVVVEKIFEIILNNNFININISYFLKLYLLIYLIPEEVLNLRFCVV